jgi:hypothetical protein
MTFKNKETKTTRPVTLPKIRMTRPMKLSAKETGAILNSRFEFDYEHEYLKEKSYLKFEINKSEK